jgi:hypothetical protein
MAAELRTREESPRGVSRRGSFPSSSEKERALGEAAERNRRATEVAIGGPGRQEEVPMGQRFRSGAVLVGLSAALACVVSCDSLPTGFEAGAGGGLGGTGSLIVYGSTVSSTSGAVTAAITVTAEDSACSGTTYGSASGGSYRISLTATSAAAGCVVVTGTVAGNPNSVSVPVSGVAFGSGDSVLVNLAFP